jgi:hypothetical protein
MPENDDPGVGEINDVEEFLREFDRVEYDETLIELVGQGYDVNAPGDQAVADLLGAWRDDVNQVPVDASRLPSAHTADGRMPPAPTTGGPVSAMDEAAKLREIAQYTSAKGMAQQILDDLTSVMEQITNALGPGHSRLGDALGPIEEVRGHVQQLAVMLDGAFDMLNDVAGSIS